MDMLTLAVPLIFWTFYFIENKKKKQNKNKNQKRYPAWGTRPNVGLKPMTPQRAAGILTDPNKHIWFDLIFFFCDTEQKELCQSCVV